MARTSSRRRAIGPVAAVLLVHLMAGCQSGKASGQENGRQTREGEALANETLISLRETGVGLGTTWDGELLLLHPVTGEPPIFSLSSRWIHRLAEEGLWPYPHLVVWETGDMLVSEQRQEWRWRKLSRDRVEDLVADLKEIISETIPPKRLDYRSPDQPFVEMHVNLGGERIVLIDFRSNDIVDALELAAQPVQGEGKVLGASAPRIATDQQGFKNLWAELLSRVQRELFQASATTALKRPWYRPW